MFQKYFQKKIFLPVFLCFCFAQAQAQTEYIVTVDPTNAAITKIDSIPGVVLVRAGSMATYSQSNHHFTIFGGKSFNANGIFNLITIDAITGHTLYNPEIIDQSNFNCLQYSRNSDAIYGSVYLQEFNLVLLNRLTANYTIIRNLPEMNGVYKLFPDEVHNRIYISARDVLANGDVSIFTIELSTGNILSRFSADGIFQIEYDYSTNMFYGMHLVPHINNNPPLPTYDFCRFDPNTGVRTDIAEIPGVYACLSGIETIDEMNGLYFIATAEFSGPTVNLNTIDIATGSLLHRVAIPLTGSALEDNLYAFRYDQTLQKLFALFWEAHTIHPPSPPPIAPVIDSSCIIDNTTKVYTQPFNHTLIVDKKITSCSVSINLVNMVGQVMIKNRMINDGYNEIALPGFSSGVYFYQLVSEGRILSSGRFFKQ